MEVRKIYIQITDMKNRQLLLIICLLTIFNLPAMNQHNDFGSWIELDLQANISDRMEASVKFSERFRNNISQFDRSLNIASLSYSLTQGFSVEGGYFFQIYNDNEMGLIYWHRFHGDFQYDKDIGNWSFQLRNRMQYAFNHFNEFGHLYSNKLVYRLKTKLTYDINTLPLEIYASSEAFVPATDNRSFHASMIRIEAGAEYDFSKNSDIVFGYLMDSKQNITNPLRAHIIVITFQYTLF